MHNMTDTPADPQPEDPSPEFQAFEELSRRLFALPPDQVQAAIDASPPPPVDPEDAEPKKAPSPQRKSRRQAVKH